MADLHRDRVGFIGVGNMGEAILRGALERGVLRSENVWVTDVRRERTTYCAERYDVHVAANNAEMLTFVDWVIFSAKPQNVADVLAEIAPALQPGQWILSIAAGVETARLERGLPDGTPVVRVMPNIAATVGEAMTAICGGTHAETAHLDAAEALFRAVGRTARVPESLMDTVTGLSGSGPAYVFLMIEALADAGVQNGLSYDQAVLLAAQTVLGAATMLLEGEEHPAVWKTRVTSPGGTTAAGLAALERGAVRAAFAEAVSAATERSRELGKRSE